jgi:death on curing protein
MNEPVWIDLADCLSLQESLLSRFGGLGGVRDEGLLDSALNRPRHLFAYGHPTLFSLAAAYAAGIIKNHPFLDGNKRAGFVTAALFLESNEQRFTAPEDEVILQTLALAAGKLSEAAYARWLEASCQAKGKRAR